LHPSPIAAQALQIVDRPAAAFAHTAHGHPGTVHRSQHIGFQNGAQFLQRDGGQVGLAVADAGVVDPDVDGAEMLRRQVPQRLDRIEFGHVARLAEYEVVSEFAGQLGGHPADGFGIPRGNDDAAIAAQELPRQPQPDSPAAAGDDDNLHLPLLRNARPWGRYPPIRYNFSQPVRFRVESISQARTGRRMDR
jgi:hypothetical protein